ncbi:putative DNA polymerase delta subunit 4 [Aspergillus affinis]|uniref:putative DNA polymerase delta subunit 4 n=1 Tax=Aspergillus affinis TaxID=1070780 RepID=UPI0022FE4547|nr:uncharacterized protein KD926_009301 [Aspergillus affinis]KAI9039576.1 hypothetical protein KD926_009301 [Aspergillus affinis]
MPPARRRGGNTVAQRSGQSTLSFGSKSRVTKPSATTPSQKSKGLDALTILPGKPSHDAISEPEESPATPSEPHVAEIAVKDQAQTEIQQPLTEEEEKALKVTEQDLRQYWKKEEAKRRAPRVHQGELSLHEKILRLFDLSSQFGPCIGIARLKRWRRANTLGLKPPIEVLAVMLKNNDDAKQRAYVDELMS